jgi:hypothetical protein
MIDNISENPGILTANAPAAAAPQTSAQVSVRARVLKGISVAALVAGIVLLGKLSFTLAAMRIYQVDECLNVFVARMIANGQSSPGMEFFQLILSWVIPASARAVDLFASARLLTWLIFWLNLILIAMATGERIFSRRWLVALAGAATLAPLWDFGFEIRHDNLLLTGILLMWGVVRFQPPRLGAFFFLGACFVGVEFVSMKGILYTVPMMLGIFVFPRPGANQPRWKLFLAWCLGAVLAFLALRMIFHAAGLGNDYLVNVKGTASVSNQTYRFSPFQLTLPRLLVQAPLLLAVVFAALIACGASLLREKRAALNWDGILPEVLLLGIALIALFTNPNPYPYNLLHVVPYAFLLAWRYGASIWKQFAPNPLFVPLAACLIVFAHLTLFEETTKRHWDKNNFHQEELMNLTEDLTDPVKDTIFDGVGMVPTRKICDMRTFIHGQHFLNLANTSSSGMEIRRFLAQNPPSVVILSDRTEWLSDEDNKFLHDRYVPLADDYMVLGNLLPAGGGTFEVFHSGRYRITSAEGSNIIGTYREPKNIKERLFGPKEEAARPLMGTVDGIPLNGKPVELSVGTHRIECGADHKAAVVWVGPQRDDVPRSPGQDRHQLFVNWY